MITLEREMASTRAEFMHHLHAVFDDITVATADCIRVVTTAAAMEITLADLPPRVIALLRLPLLQVRICFTHGDEAACTAMLQRFDQAMMRCGG